MCRALRLDLNSVFFLFSSFLQVIQLLSTPDGQYHVWTRWGRVGEPGQNALKQGLRDQEVMLIESDADEQLLIKLSYSLAGLLAVA